MNTPLKIGSISLFIFVISVDPLLSVPSPTPTPTPSMLIDADDTHHPTESVVRLPEEVLKKNFHGY